MNTNANAQREEVAEFQNIPKSEAEHRAQASRSHLISLLSHTDNKNALMIPVALLNDIQRALNKHQGSLPKAADELQCTMAFLDAVINRYELKR